MVDSKTELAVLALGKAKAVVAVATGNDLGGQLRDGTNFAGKVGGVVAGELEASVLDAVVLADVEVGNVDVLVCGWVRGSAAVCWVGAASCLGSRGCEGSGQKSRDDGGDCELHLVICVGR